MSETGVVTDNGALKLERVLLTGDLAALTVEERIAYYQAICASVGLNPLSRPFDYLVLNGRTVLYAKRDATDQLRKLHGVSITRLERERIDDVYVVTAHASMPNGRTDTSIGAVAIGNLRGEALANALMKSETKSKRRVTLSICGLGVLDETEVETIPGATVAPAEGGSAHAAVEDAGGVEAIAPAVRFAGNTDQRAKAFKEQCYADCGLTIVEIQTLLGCEVRQYMADTHHPLEQIYGDLWGYVHAGRRLLVNAGGMYNWRQPADAAPSDEEAAIAHDDGE